MFKANGTGKCVKRGKSDDEGCKGLRDMIHVIPSQMSGLSLTPIDGKEVGELTELTPESLTDIDKEGVQYEITVLEEKLAQMKPNMAAIAEYRKKVGKGLNQS